MLTMKRFLTAAALLAGILLASPAKATITVSIANAGTTGTTNGLLAKLTGAPSTAVVTATTDTGGIIGVVVSGGGITGNALIATDGIAPCTFDASGVVAGHYVQNSTTTAGNCKDGGATYPASGQVLGIALATVASGSANMVVIPPGNTPTVGGGAPTRPFTLTWGPGQNLAAATLPMGTAFAASTVVNIGCAVGSVTGAANSSVDLWFAPTGTILSSGTKINSTSCNANGTINSTQTMGSITNANIPAGNDFGAVATGAGWTSTSPGSGMVHLVLQ
jgi:hypothetical protein